MRYLFVTPIKRIGDHRCGANGWGWRILERSRPLHPRTQYVIYAYRLCRTECYGLLLRWTQRATSRSDSQADHGIVNDRKI